MNNRGRGYAGLFIFLFAISVLVFLLPAFLGGREISELENRVLTSFPPLNAESFLSSSFQDNLENALGDHLLGSEEIRSLVRNSQAAALNAEQEFLFAFDPALKSGYSQIADEYYSYGGDPCRIVEKPVDYTGWTDRLKEFAGQVNAVPDVQVYIYFIQNSRSVDFDRPEKSNALYDWVCSFFRCENSGAFSFKDYEDYCRWFYQTDHHWNNRGSYRGYCEIVALLNKGTPLECGEEAEFPFVFNGSYARQTHRLCADEPFRVFSFDLPKHTVTLNGKRGKYGRLDAYLKGRYEADSLTNHYANCYGGEYGEIVYDFGTTGKGNLLLIASSYSNPINALIASHFDRTTIVDPRYWEKWTGGTFDPAVCAERAEADTILLLGDIHLFTSDLSGEGGTD